MMEIIGSSKPFRNSCRANLLVTTGATVPYAVTATSSSGASISAVNPLVSIPFAVTQTLICSYSFFSNVRLLCRLPSEHRDLLPVFREPLINFLLLILSLTQLGTLSYLFFSKVDCKNTRNIGCDLSLYTLAIWNGVLLSVTALSELKKISYTHQQRINRAVQPVRESASFTVETRGFDIGSTLPPPALLPNGGIIVSAGTNPYISHGGMMTTTGVHSAPAPALVQHDDIFPFYRR